MKEENQASKFEGVFDLRRHPIDPEHYGTVAKATAEALAEEIADRFLQSCLHIKPGDPADRKIYQAAASTLTDWFTGKWTPGGKRLQSLPRVDKHDHDLLREECERLRAIRDGCERMLQERAAEVARLTQELEETQGLWSRACDEITEVADELRLLLAGELLRRPELPCATMVAD